MATKGYNLEQTGEQVQAALNKAINLGPATEEADGLMTATDKASLEHLNSVIDTKVDKVTGKGLSTNDFTNEDKDKLDTAYQVPSTGIPASDMSSGVQTSLNKANSAVQPADLVPITEKIPAQASAQNQLADKAFVNSSISTASADFRGTYDSLAELQAVTADKNDYGYVVSTDEAGNTVYSRYKYNGSSWVFEYDLNNSSFTAAEWASIQSQITVALVQKLSALPTNQELGQSLSGKQDIITDLSTIRSGAAAGATAYQKPGTGIPSTDMASAVQTSLGKADTAYQKPSGGVPKSDLASSVQTSLGKADTAIQPAEFNELEEEVGTIGNGAYEEAWDGSSAPVVADIPAGVSVTYNSTSYTGTLAASASTVDKIYLVSDGNGNYDRYVTVESSGTYSWKKVGTTAIPLSNYATESEVSQLRQEVTADVSQLEAKLVTSAIVDGMALGTEGTGRINADGSRTWNNSYKYRDIPNNGYTRVVGHGSTYKNLIYLAFYNSATPGSSSLISSLTADSSNVDINFDEVVPQGTVTITVGWGLTAPATTAAINLYKNTDRLDQIEDRLDVLEDVTEDLPDLEETVDDLLTKTHFVTKTEDDFTLVGYYNSENTNLTDKYHYVSLPLINVQEGQKIYWHGWATGESFKTSQAICCYDNDNLPYNGTDARIDFNELNTIDYVNGEFSFIVPTNCSQVGISFTFYSYPVPDGAHIQIGDNKYTLTDAGAELVNSAIGMNEETGDKSANYFLKGNSNIVVSPSKKLGIIAAGQSNIDGRNSYSDLPAGFVNPNAKVRFCNNTSGTFADFQVTDGGANNDWSFDAIVYDLLTKSAYGNQSEIYVMKKSMGGTSIDKDGATNYHWTADYEYLTSETYSLLRTFEKTIRKGEETQGTNFEIRAFLWHQGEGDADTQAVANRYYDNLKNMLAYVRGVVGNPRLDFFCGNLSTHNVSNPYVSVINAAYAKLASEDPYFHCVDMRNATLEDSWHFDYEWSIYFGQKVYDMMIDAGIITGTKINPSEPS